MTLNSADLFVIIDAIRGSLLLSDNGKIFSTTYSSRETALYKVIKLMESIPVSIHGTPIEESSGGE